MTKHFIGVVVVLLMSLLSISNGALGGTGMGQDWLSVEIVNYLQSVEYSMAGPQSTPILVSKHPRADAPLDPLGQISIHISETRGARKQATKLLDSQFGQNIKWANFSPDKRFVLVGLEDPSFESMTSATLFRTADSTVISQVKSEGLIHDSQWSPDSSSVAILESTERMSKTPWGLFAALSGHPVQLQTFYVRFIDSGSHNEKRVKVTTDIENAVAELRLSQ